MHPSFEVRTQLGDAQEASRVEKARGEKDREEKDRVAAELAQVRGTLAKTEIKILAILGGQHSDLKKGECRAVQRSSLCRLWRELSNAYLLAKFRFDTAENEPSGDVDLIRHETTQVEQYHAVAGRHRRDGCDPDRERSASLFSAPASVTGGFLAGGREKTATRR